MGRYKDYQRGSKRGGYEDDSTPDGRPFERQPFSSLNTPQASAPIDVVLKKFNAEKGFGFVTLAGEPDAFIHISRMQAAGYSRLPEGARLKVRIGQGQRGPEVTEVIEVGPGADQLVNSAERGRASPSRVVGQTNEMTGTVKLYKADKGFGFIGQDGGGKDVFVHATALERAGLSKLAEGQRVRMQIGEGQKGLEARSIELLD
jgi:CspA family cold shock protein